MRPRRPLDESPAAAASDPTTAATGDAFIKEQLAALTAIITSVKSDIGQAEARTVAKIDTKVDVLAVKLQTRMSRAETDLARLGTEMAVMREPLDALKLAAEERERGPPSCSGREYCQKEATGSRGEVTSAPGCGPAAGQH